jgi:hypothetical protein
MRVARLALWAVTCVACARAGAGDTTDPGDSPTAPMGASGSGEGSPSPNGTTSADDEGSPNESGDGGADASTGNGADGALEAGDIEGEAVADGMVVVPEASPDGSACLLAIPSSCPNCMTQNASDKPACQLYLQCFIANDCDPSAACGSNDGVCGVNTVGGGEAPYTAAVATYDCACP